MNVSVSSTGDDDGDDDKKHKKFYNKMKIKRRKNIQNKAKWLPKIIFFYTHIFICICRFYSCT